LDEGERWKLLTVRHWDESPIGEWTLSIVDLKEGDTDACVSKARGWIWPYCGEEITCDALEYYGYCEAGVLDPFVYLTPEEFDELSVFVDNGLTAAEACCACGGAGLDSDEIDDQLRQWRLVVYGRDGDTSKNPTSMPSLAVSSAPAPATPISTTATGMATQNSTAVSGAHYAAGQDCRSLVLLLAVLGLVGC
jgi:hypothetical protein